MGEELWLGWQVIGQQEKRRACTPSLAGWATWEKSFLTTPSLHFPASKEGITILTLSLSNPESSPVSLHFLSGQGPESHWDLSPAEAESKTRGLSAFVQRRAQHSLTPLGPCTAHHLPPRSQELSSHCHMSFRFLGTSAFIYFYAVSKETVTRAICKSIAAC